MSAPSHTLRIAAVVAMLFGLMTIFAGGRALVLGVPGGAVVPFVLWFNFIAGFAYVLAGAGLWRNVPWGRVLALIIALATGAVWLAFLWHLWQGGAAMGRTMAALPFRVVVWAVLAWIGFRFRR